MNEDKLLKKLTEICSSDNFSTDYQLLNEYSNDLSFVEGKLPLCVIWPRKTEDVKKILKLANSMNFAVVPVSSSSSMRRHGDTIPQKDNTVIINLSNMNKILDIDKKNRVVMVEPGVTFGQLIPKLTKQGVRLLTPLLPNSDKSVMVSALDREPITIPRYHWDSSDPLLCTEVVFGNGDLFRTGSAAGPGTIKEQKKTGQAQKNPMGPTQFSPYRVLQGSQGTMGVVTWASLKLEFLPTIQKVNHLQSDNLQKLLELQHELIKYRLCDELFILNNMNLACLVESNPQAINDLASKLSKWNLIYILSGRGKLANDKISYLEGDINDAKKDLSLEKLKNADIINDSALKKCVSGSTKEPWKNRLKGGFQDIFFLTNFEKVGELIAIAEKEISQDLGIYIQIINQGTAIHCEFDLYYNPQDDKATQEIKDKFMSLSTKLMDSGAFFNRPYKIWADEVYKRHSDATSVALKKVKAIFDPNNVLNPGSLCFD